MIYKEFKGKKLSALGMGCMRFPIKDGQFTNIDEEKTAEMFDYAIKNGINYFDTAYMYHGGQSEIITGKLLKKYPRESYYIADKFPGETAVYLLVSPTGCIEDIPDEVRESWDVCYRTEEKSARGEEYTLYRIVLE